MSPQFQMGGPEELVISMDLVSCYGKGLQSIPYPVGHPILIYFPAHKPEKWITLKDFLKKWSRELVPNCWYAVIDTCEEHLSFHQDLLFSKYLGSKDIPTINEKKGWEEDFKFEDGHLRGQFFLITQQVRNGILTDSSLKLLATVSSSIEWMELKLKLKVKAAMIYPKSLRVEYTGEDSVELWKKKVTDPSRKASRIEKNAV